MFQLDIITPTRQAYSKDVKAVFVPTVNGQIGVLPRHISLLTTLTEGEIKVVEEGKDIFLAIGGGFMEVAKNRVLILVTRAVHADELNQEEIQKAYQSAREIMKKKEKTMEREQALATFKRSLVEMKLLKRTKRRQSPLTI